MAKELPPDQRKELLTTLQSRFEQHMERHEGVSWSDVEKRLTPAKLCSLNEMERTGGQPDVVGGDNDGFLFFDCSPESPEGRRSLCFDKKALKERKKHKPDGSAIDMAERMGIQLLSEDQYRELQELGEFDTKTSSWIQTPDDIRERGGALFCDRRYGAVFVYHNGAQSYYASRGFRGCLRV